MDKSSKNNFRQTQEYLWLLKKVTGKSLVEIIIHPPQLTQEQQKQLDVWEHEHTVLHKPIAYILGSVPFCGLEILVEPPVLIPRPETEEWVDALIKELHSTPLNIADVCTGSGCIALALAHAFPESSVTGFDIADHALTLAQKNKDLLGIANVTFAKSDLLSNTHDLFDVIVSNPPYIAPHELESLEPSVRNWEDAHALIAQQNGFELIQRLIVQARSKFKKNSLGLLVLEVGHTQAPTVCTMLEQARYTDIKTRRDFANKERVVLARYQERL